MMSFGILTSTCITCYVNYDKCNQLRWFIWLSRYRSLRWWNVNRVLAIMYIPMESIYSVKFILAYHSYFMCRLELLLDVLNIIVKLLAEFNWVLPNFNIGVAASPILSEVFYGICHWNTKTTLPSHVDK